MLCVGQPAVALGCAPWLVGSRRRRRRRIHRRRRRRRCCCRPCNGESAAPVDLLQEADRKTGVDDDDDETRRTEKSNSRQPASQPPKLWPPLFSLCVSNGSCSLAAPPPPSPTLTLRSHGGRSPGGRRRARPSSPARLRKTCLAPIINSNLCARTKTATKSRKLSNRATDYDDSEILISYFITCVSPSLFLTLIR